MWGGTPAASLLDAAELLLLERLLTCVGCNGKARDEAGTTTCCTNRLQLLSLKPYLIFNHRHSTLSASLQKLLRLL